MNKILLIYPRTGVPNNKPQSPLSLLAICPGLEANGFEPVVVDSRVKNNYKEIICRHLSDSLFVGLSTMTGYQIRYALEIARFIRQQSSNAILVWGGVHPSLLPEETINHPLVDIVCVGEGEETVVDIARCIRERHDLSTVKGIYYKDKLGVVHKTGSRPLLGLSTLPMPAWHLVDIRDYSEIGVQTGRGCPWRCRFCYNLHYNERKWRAKSVNQVMDELRLLKERYAVRQVMFYDDNFFTNPKRVRELAERFISEKLDIRWSTTCRADYIAQYDDSFIELLKRSGVDILFVGSESGSEKILSYIQKDITVQDIRDMAKKAMKHQLCIHTIFMVGFSVETEEDRCKTFDLMDEIKGIYPDISISSTCIYTPYPGNELYQEAIRAGFVVPHTLEEWTAFAFFECHLPWMSSEVREKLENLAFITRFVFWSRDIKEHYLRPKYYLPYVILRLSALLRWRLRWFSYAWEWKLFRRFVKRFMD